MTGDELAVCILGVIGGLLLGAAIGAFIVFQANAVLDPRTWYCSKYSTSITNNGCIQYTPIPPSHQ